MAAAPVVETAPRSTPDSRNGRPGSNWVRVARDAKGKPRGLQTAVVHYVPQGADRPGLTVDLIAAVHVADRAYYTWLNGRFEIYDAVLYELVAPPGASVPQRQRGPGRHPVGALQDFIKRALELEHQLAHIDYTKKNLVHADMSPAQFAQSMENRGESFGQMIFRLLGRSLAQQSEIQARGGSPDVDLLAALFDTNRALRLKTILAEQFDQMETLLVGLGGASGSTLIEGRNAVAMTVLDQQIEAGKKKLAVFYGAGHLPDMDRRLRDQVHLKPVRTLWVTAWDLGSR